jgi:hypothetical protein
MTEQQHLDLDGVLPRTRIPKAFEEELDKRTATIFSAKRSDVIRYALALYLFGKRVPGAATPEPSAILTPTDGHAEAEEVR